MNSNSPWQKHFSQKNRSFYYFNVKDHSSLWVVESCEEGWGRTLIDPKHPERGEKYVNILTNRVFYSEAEFKRYIGSKSNQAFVKGEESDCRQSNSYSTPQLGQTAPTNRESEKRSAVDDGFSSLGSGFSAQTSEN